MYYLNIDKIRPYRCVLYVYGLLCLLAPIATLALPDDTEQPIYIASNSAVKDDKQGVTIYQGAVDITQGSMKIKADQVTIYSKNDTVNKIVATGTPATFKQQPAAHRGDVLAKGDRIEYQPKEKIITLLHNASLIQDDGSSISGNEIEYNIDATRAEAKAGDSNERVNVIIPPPQASP
ncbi:MAG: lipopolysaccharide transport periplasmic protein LptA [Cellvibrionaceae bacterium]|nr:lipopolysaccharide transport periplasmic protein LptA [Cellvibrionaceae bacterium]